MARYKVLKSVAHSFGHSFTSLLNYWGDNYIMGHLLQSARETRTSTLRLNILSGQAAPDTLLTEPVRQSLDRYCQWFPQLVATHQTSRAVISAAHMSIVFDLTTERPNATSPQFIESPYICRVEIVDDRGKIWSAELRDWWCVEGGLPVPIQDAKPRATPLAWLHRLFRTVRFGGRQSESGPPAA